MDRWIDKRIPERIRDVCSGSDVRAANRHSETDQTIQQHSNRNNSKNRATMTHTQKQRWSENTLKQTDFLMSHTISNHLRLFGLNWQISRPRDRILAELNMTDQ